MSCIKEDVCISIIFIRISENLNLTVLGPVFQDFFSRCERVFQRMLVFKKKSILSDHCSCLLDFVTASLIFTMSLLNYLVEISRTN